MRMGKNNPPQDLKVVGYLRVSSLEQTKDGVSLERQAEQIKSYCSLKGLSNLKFISDKGLSGYKASRPGFQQLLNLCKSKQVKMVIVYDLSRLSRSVRDTLAFIEDIIHKYEIEFVSLQNDIDTTSAVGKAFLGISAIFNQLYRDEISEKTKEALRHKRSNGEKTGGIIPFGYRLVGDSRLIAFPEEAQTIKHIYKLRKQGLSLREIVYRLHVQGIKTKTGKEKWNPKVIKQILERQVLEITHDTEISDRDKDYVLEDAVGALYDIHERQNMSQKEAIPLMKRSSYE